MLWCLNSRNLSAFQVSFSKIQSGDTRGSQILTVGMLAVAYTDERLHADESSVLQETVEIFGFSEDEVRHMKMLAKAEVDVSNEIDAFIG